MLLQFQSSLEECIVRMLAASPWQSALSLQRQIGAKFGRYSVRGIYKELAKLERQGIVVKVRSTYSLRLAWVIELASFVEELYDRYLSPEILISSLGQDGNRLSWRFTSPIKMDLAFTQLMLGLTQIYPSKPLCIWCPHQWFNLAHGDSIKQFFKANELAGVKRYHIIGGQTFLDKLGAAQLPKGSELSMAEGPFEDLRDTYFTVIGEHVLSAKLDRRSVERIEQLFQEVTTAAELKQYSLQEFFATPVKAKLTLEANSRKAAKLKQQFAEFFGLTAEKL